MKCRIHGSYLFFQQNALLRSQLKCIVLGIQFCCSNTKWCRSSSFNNLDKNNSNFSASRSFSLWLLFLYTPEKKSVWAVEAVLYSCDLASKQNQAMRVFWFTRISYVLYYSQMVCLTTAKDGVVRDLASTSIKITTISIHPNRLFLIQLSGKKTFSTRWTKASDKMVQIKLTFYPLFFMLLSSFSCSQRYRYFTVKYFTLSDRF